MKKISNVKTQMSTNNNNFAIRLSNVSKKYTIHHEKPTLAERLIRGKNEEFWALKDINLEIKKGEKVGIIGPNGSGKTTLLKIIAGITTATVGNIETFGKIVSLIDLEAGFHPDLTGEQNIFLNGLIIGMQKEEIRNKLKNIVDFTDIGNFIDAPLFTYSQGMKLRLGFSIAIHSDLEILILDEGMATGDLRFQQKAHKSIEKLFHQGKTIIVVTQWMDFLRKNCKRIIYLEKGELNDDGDQKIITKYCKL